MIKNMLSIDEGWQVTMIPLGDGGVLNLISPHDTHLRI